MNNSLHPILKADRGFWRNRKVCVTGASGLLGSWLIKTLIEFNSDVTILLRSQSQISRVVPADYLKKIQTVIGSVEDLNSIERMLESNNRIEIFFHLAASNMNRGLEISPYRLLETNVRGAYNALEACCNYLDKKGCFITASSVEATTDPQDRTRSFQPYAVSKQCLEQICESFRISTEMNINVVRLPNIFGGGDFNMKRIVPSTIMSVIKNENPVLNTTCSSQREFLYVEDAVHAFLLVAQRQYKNFSSGANYHLSGALPLHRMSNLQLVNEIISISRKSHLHPITPTEGSGNRRLPPTRISDFTPNDALDWEPTVSLREGLRATLSWYHSDLEQQEEG
jgi:CDP-glucose 4,6-dehydratase